MDYKRDHGVYNGKCRYGPGLRQKPALIPQDRAWVSWATFHNRANGSAEFLNGF